MFDRETLFIEIFDLEVQITVQQCRNLFRTEFLNCLFIIPLIDVKMLQHCQIMFENEKSLNL